MFGANLTLTTDVDLRSDVIDRFAEAGITELRYPGGTVTEQFFDISDIAGGSHNKTVGTFQTSGETDLIAFSDFMDLANTINTSTTLVIPTTNGFTESAGEALLSGSFGNRTISADYIEDVADFVAVAVQEAQDKGVRLSAFEIGNEFWAFGRMAASEYGRLAAAVSQTIETTLLELGLARADQPDIVVQTLSGAGTFSPNGENTVFVDPQTGFVFEPHVIGRANVPPLDALTEVTVPSQGKARTQNIAINDAFARDVAPLEDANGGTVSLDISQAANAIDGVSEHYYLDGGFDAVNTEEQFMFNQLEFWRQNTAGRDADLPELDFYITEWNVRRGTDVDEGNNRGLQQAQMDVAIFYEMATHDVSTAHFWPSLFDLSRSVSLVCFCRGHLTVVGEAYAQLTRSEGMTPMLDFRDPGNVAIHGFEAGAKSFYILSERSGAENELNLDFSEVRDPDATAYRISWTELWDGGAGGQDEVAAQTLTKTEFTDLVPADALDSFLITMQAWSQVYVDIEAVTDTVPVTSGPVDRVVTVVRGDDALSLGDISVDGIPNGPPHHTVIDTHRFILQGGLGDDTLVGGADDDLLRAYAGDDLLQGGAGEDTADFTAISREAVSFRVIADGVRVSSALGRDDLVGIELIEFADQTVRVAEVSAEIAGVPGLSETGTLASDILMGTDDNDTLVGLDGDDLLFGGLGADLLIGDAGNDTIAASGGHDDVDGGEDDDSIGGGTGDDIIDGGLGDDVIGAGLGDDSANGGDGNDIVNGGAGNDSLDGGSGNDTMGSSFGNDLVNGGLGNDDMGGGEGRDTIDAGAGDDSVGGGEGDDVILGGDGGDFLAGGGRNDQIDGGAGDDSINGGDGDDMMQGGTGADVFVFNFFKDGDADVITDYEDGTDSFVIRTVNPDTGQINLDNGGLGLQGFVGALGITDTVGGAQMTIGGHLVLVEGIAAADLTVDDFLFL